MTKQEYSDLFAKIIKDNDLYGRSFTLGVALYCAVSRGYIDGWDILDDLTELSGVNYRTPRGAVEDIDLALLDEYARYISGEDEE